MALGLGSGLLLAVPLVEWLSNHNLGSNARITNPFAAWSRVGDQDILLLGTDEEGGLTDVIASLRIDGGITKVTQIPRDTYIEPEGYGPQKVNALYPLGGTELVKRELSRKLGRPISHHVVVNLAAIRRMADALGGIEVDVPKRMNYADNTQGLVIDLQPGLQTLRGRDLEGFLRFRHDEQGGAPAAGPAGPVPQAHPAGPAGASADAAGPGRQGRADQPRPDGTGGPDHRHGAYAPGCGAAGWLPLHPRRHQLLGGLLAGSRRGSRQP
jgi:LCP family protein required for cell wall assembly